MKSVPDFIPGHKGSKDIIVLGLSPSSRTKAFKNGTFARLLTWCQAVDLKEWDFHNIIPNKINVVDIKEVDVEALLECTKDRKKIIALGGIVSRVCTKYKIPHHKLDHPSPRNRNLNSKEYELAMLEELRKYLYD
jgi:hypothetical protein